MPENRNSSTPNGAIDYEAVYQNALQIIRQAWLDAGITARRLRRRGKAFGRFQGRSRSALGKRRGH